MIKVCRSSWTKVKLRTHIPLPKSFSARTNQFRVDTSLAQWPSLGFLVLLHAARSKSALLLAVFGGGFVHTTLNDAATKAMNTFLFRQQLPCALFHANEHQVNISEECRERILATDVTAYDIFDEARTEVLVVMEVRMHSGNCGPKVVRCLQSYG